MNAILASLLLATTIHAAVELTPPVATDLRDPIELAVADDGDLYVIEREGRVLRVHPETGAVFEIGRLEVSALRATAPDSPVAREDGMLGIALDPDFSETHHLYLYYSDPAEFLNRLSRFTLRDGRLDPGSETTLLEIPTERTRKVCHHGGSMAFGPDGLLYLSTGDNTNPFESRGYAPIDDRPGREHFDAQRSAGNTNDLRGKILRLRPTESGYEIPEGNLFPPGTPDTRPEIYVMGCRNPYRLSIDPETGALYWGEVGPDARRAGPPGPKGHDEVNRATEAGNYGWPFVIADNRPYAIIDFTNGEAGRVTDPAAPVNPGSRNTGRTELPPARPALIRYTYERSPDFPALGGGSRNAMAGPVFHYNESRRWNALGRGDDGALLVYDWARGKLWKASFGEHDEVDALEPVAGELRHPIDLETAPDGTLWLLEYGTAWYFNEDGRIRGIRPADDNRPPEVAIEPVPETAGTYRVAKLADADGGEPEFRWWLTDGVTERDLGAAETVTVPPDTIGELRAVAIDGEGATAIARLRVGAEAAKPALALRLPNAPDALGFGETLAYEVTAPEPPDADTVSVRARYIPPTGHDSGGPELPANIHELMTARACIACHQVDRDSVGPRLLDVAVKYRDQPGAIDLLRTRLEEGSVGRWGEVPMPPQAAVSDEEAETVLRAILGLADGVAIHRDALEGKIRLPAPPTGAAPGGAWEILAEAPGHLPARATVPAE